MKRRGDDDDDDEGVVDAGTGEGRRGGLEGGDDDEGTERSARLGFGSRCIIAAYQMGWVMSLGGYGFLEVDSGTSSEKTPPKYLRVEMRFSR